MPPFAFERAGFDVEQLNVRLDSVPIPAVCSSNDSRVFFLTDLPSFEVWCDNEPVYVFVIDQVASE
jgi:hypothetical protein